MKKGITAQAIVVLAALVIGGEALAQTAPTSTPTPRPTATRTPTATPTPTKTPTPPSVPADSQASVDISTIYQQQGTIGVVSTCKDQIRKDGVTVFGVGEISRAPGRSDRGPLYAEVEFTGQRDTKQVACIPNYTTLKGRLVLSDTLDKNARDGSNTVVDPALRVNRQGKSVGKLSKLQFVAKK